VRVGKKAVELTLELEAQGSQSTALERWSVAQKSGLFVEVFGIPIEVTR
jgi:hypothetical protein